jgi:Ig-like domain from next to BRCA1 gene
MNTSRRKLILWFAAAIVMLACETPLLPIPTSLNPPPAPNSIGTIVVQTAAAAQTQTAFLRPPDTKTPTQTPPPTGTPTETPTPTETVIFILPTSTKPFTAIDAGSECKLIALDPYNPILAPKTNFDAKWTLQNTGSDLWLDQIIDFKFSGGTDMHKKDLYDLPSSVNPDGQVDITVPMTAPNKPGTYTSTWELVRKKTTLCKVSVTVTVK